MPQQFTVPSWFYFIGQPVAGSLSINGTDFSFEPVSQYDKMANQSWQRFTIGLRSVVAARLSRPFSSSFEAHNIYTTSSDDNHFHLILSTATGKAEFALGAGQNIVGTTAFLSEAVRQLVLANNGHHVRPLL